ncbi:MAG TPA: BREX system ATP-binding protein BrxD [Acidimicrobiales bacterium]|nr:BREX system ATP-binding protein BrxD [Acidimicrobiales bacterium]
MSRVSIRRRDEIIDALRRGTVPHAGLDTLAVGLDQFVGAFDAELDTAAGGRGVFKAVRGEYGSGKTFLARWLAERAKQRGFATAEVQISETETPLHRLETVYRRLVERLATASEPAGALRSIIDAWYYALEEDVLATGTVTEHDTASLAIATQELAERRLGDITRSAPAFAAVLRAYRRAAVAGDHATAEGLLAWLGGQPNVAATIKRAAGIKGDLDHFGALSSLQGLLAVLRDAGHPGLLIVLDEVETLQRVRSDVRDKGLNALRQFIDEIDAGRFPGLFVLVTGTPAFFEGPQGVQRLAPLAARLATDFTTDARFDNPRAIQIRLPGFDLDALIQMGQGVRGLYLEGSLAARRIRDRCDDPYLGKLARAITGELGGRVGVTPRLFLKKLVGDILDRIDQFPDFDPNRDYRLTVIDTELTDVERNARAAVSVDEIELDV